MKIEPLEIVEANSAGDNLTAQIDYKGAVAIEVSEPWSGDTEAGFGRSGAIRLTRDQALELASWLMDAAEAIRPEKAK